MSLRMVSLWIVGTLLVAAKLNADPPQTEPVPPVPVVREAAIPPTAKAASADRRQIHFDVKVWDVDHATLRALTKSDAGLYQFYKANGLVKLPEGITVHPPELELWISPLPVPVRAIAVRNGSVSKTLLGRDISSAFKTIAEPSLVATNGREATMLSGGEVPILLSRPDEPTVIAFQKFGLGMKILSALADNGRIVLALDFEKSERHSHTSDSSGTANPLIATQGFRLSMDMKLGEHLLVAQQFGNPDVTRLVQIQPSLVADQSVLPNETTPVLQRAAAQQPQPIPFKTHGGILGEEADVEKFVIFQVRVYEVDHSQLPGNGDLKKVQAAFDEMLRPWLDGWRGSKLDKGGVAAWATKGTVPVTEVEKLKGVVRLVSEPKLAVDDGQIGSFDYGGKTPQIEIYEQHQGTSRTSPLATTFALESTVTDAGRLVVSVYFDKHGSPRKKRSTTEELKQHGLRVVSELSVGQTLCLSDARFNSNHTDDSLLVTITPVEINAHEEERRLRPVAAKPAKPKELEITVEDRWPLGDIKVGQRVAAIPVTIENTSLMADLMAIWSTLEDGEQHSQRVTRIEPLDNKSGRRVTVTVPFVNSNEDSEEKALINSYLERAATASTTFVIPASKLTITDVYDSRLLHEMFNHIPIESRPRPVELTINETFTAVGIGGLMNSKTTGTTRQLGPFSMELLDDDAGGFWRVTATRIGAARLFQLAMGGNMIGPARVTDYIVKADTRELELHIRQQFPSAKVTITSVGANAVMLKGTVASEEDSRGIIELGEQFAPKVLNRMKVGEALDSTLSSVQQANSVQPGAMRVIKPHRSDDSKSDEWDLVKTLNQEYPNGDLEIQIVGDKTIVSGGRYSPDEAAQIIKTVEKFSENVVNKLVIDRPSSHGTSPISEPQRVKPHRAARDVPSKPTDLQQLRDEIRELIQRLDRQKDSASNSAHAVPPAPELKALVPVPPAEVNDNAWRMLGVQFTTLTDSETKQLGPKYRGGMKVTGLRPDSPAAKNGIRQGDILVGLHVWEICGFENLNFVLTHPHLATMSQLKLYIVRGTETLSLLATPRAIAQDTDEEFPSAP